MRDTPASALSGMGGEGGQREDGRIVDGQEKSNGFQREQRIKNKLSSRCKYLLEQGFDALVAVVQMHPFSDTHAHDCIKPHTAPGRSAPAEEWRWPHLS